jgi:hypothetical protein
MYPDVLISTFGAPHILFKNMGGKKFKEITEESGKISDY